MNNTNLPVGDVDYVKKSVDFIKFLKENTSKNKSELINALFSKLLTPYYDCMFDGMAIEVGNFIYRLSDLIPEDERETVEIYPGGEVWYNLNDWRKEWSRNKTIPAMNLLNNPIFQEIEK